VVNALVDQNGLNCGNRCRVYQSQSSNLRLEMSEHDRFDGDRRCRDGGATAEPRDEPESIPQSREKH
jgi:hypothetical protein